MNDYLTVRKLVDWPILLGFALGMLVLAFVVYPPVANWGAQEINDSALAAWVQAISSIVALAIAIGVPLFLKVKGDLADREERELEACSLAITILPSVDVMAVRATWLRCRVKATRAGDDLYSNYSAQVESKINIPPLLHERLDSLHKLGAVAIPLQKAILAQRWLYENAGKFNRAAQVMDKAPEGDCTSELEFIELWAARFIAFTDLVLEAKTGDSRLA